MIVYVIEEIGGNENFTDSLIIMVNDHYHGEKRVITREVPSMMSVQRIQRKIVHIMQDKTLFQGLQQWYHLPK